MGNYVQVIGRSQTDIKLMKIFESNFNKSSKRFDHHQWLLPIVLPFDELENIDHLYKYHQFINSDHSSFYFQTNDHLIPTMPTIYITDTRT